VRPTLRGVSASTGTFVLQPFVKVTRQSHPPKLSPSHSLKSAPSFLARVSSIKGYTEIGASLFATEKTRLCPRTGNFCFVHRAPPHPLLDKSTPRLTVPLVPLSPSPPPSAPSSSRPIPREPRRVELVRSDVQLDRPRRFLVLVRDPRRHRRANTVSPAAIITVLGLGVVVSPVTGGSHNPIAAY